MVETTYATLEAKSLFIVKYTLLPEGISLLLATKEPLKGFLQSICTALWFWEVPVAWASAQRIWPSLVSPGFTVPGALFAKSPVKATLLGITNDNHDLSVDLIRTALLPGLQKTFNLPTSLQLKIQARGAPPKGGGEVLFTSPIVKKIKPILLVDEGKIKRMRGLAYSTRVSPQTANRMVDSARGLLNHWIPDVYIYTDHYKGEESGKSPIE